MHRVGRNTGKVRWIRRYWVAMAVVALLALAFAAMSQEQASAAPPASRLYQTVPKPTATPGNGSVATATPRPDDNDDNGQPGAGDQDATGDSQAPVFFLAPPASTATLTATVTVATLNVREGPGTSFPSIGVLRAGDEVQVLSRNQDNTWWVVCCVAGTDSQGWVSAQLVEPSFDRAQSADLLPVFGAAVQAAAAPATTPTAQAPAAKLPLVLNVALDPALVWQGQSADVVLEVSNPNSEAVRNVELSDELPSQLELVTTSATGNGKVSEQATPKGATLVLVRWDTVPAGGSVKVTLSVKVTEDIEDGSVFDNLAAVRGANALYTTASLTIGMPPKQLPDFQ